MMNLVKNLIKETMYDPTILLMILSAMFFEFHVPFIDGLFTMIGRIVVYLIIIFGKKVYCFIKNFNVISIISHLNRSYKMEGNDKTVSITLNDNRKILLLKDKKLFIMLAGSLIYGEKNGKRYELNILPGIKIPDAKLVGYDDYVVVESDDTERYVSLDDELRNVLILKN